MLKYQHRDAVSTLSEGLAEHHASRADLIDGRGLSDRAREPVSLLELRREYGIEVVTVY